MDAEVSDSDEFQWKNDNKIGTSKIVFDEVLFFLHEKNLLGISI